MSSSFVCACDVNRSRMVEVMEWEDEKNLELLDGDVEVKPPL